MGLHQPSKGLARGERKGSHFLGRGGNWCGRDAQMACLVRRWRPLWIRAASVTLRLLEAAGSGAEEGQGDIHKVLSRSSTFRVSKDRKCHMSTSAVQRQMLTAHDWKQILLHGVKHRESHPQRARY